MPIDPTLAAGVRAPQFESPFQTIGMLMQLRGQISEIALRQAEIQQRNALAEQNRLKAEQDRRNLAGEARLQEIMRDPVSGQKIVSGDISPLLGEVPEAIADRVHKNSIDNLNKQALTDTETLKNRATALSGLADGLAALRQDPANFGTNLQAFKNSPASQLLFKNAGIDPAAIPPSQNVDDADKWEMALGLKQAETKATLALKEQQAKAGKEDTEAQVAAFEAPVKAAIARSTLADADLLSPEQREKANEAANKPTTTLGAEEQFVQEYQKLHGGTIAQAQRAYALNKDLPSKADPTAALDRESTRFAKPHEKSLADSGAQLEKIADARAMINGSAEAQALGIPKVLTALVSGPASGVRITQPELNSIASARGIGGTFEGWASQLSGQGKLTDTQKNQLTQILDDVAVRLKQKQALANDALDRINGAHSRDEIVKIDSDVRKKLTDMEHVSGGGGIPTPTSQAEYNALPKGAQFKKPNDSKVYVKQ